MCCRFELQEGGGKGEEALTVYVVSRLLLYPHFTRSEHLTLSQVRTARSQAQAFTVQSVLQVQLAGNVGGERNSLTNYVVSWLPL